MSTKTYSNKSNARRAARKVFENDTDFNLVQNDEGRWMFHATTEYNDAQNEAFENEQPVIGEYVYCPHCGVHLDNGARDNETDWDEFLAGHFVPDNKQLYIAQMTAVQHQYQCMACGEDFGPEVTLALPKEKKTVSKATGNGLKIEENREERNGIKRPSIGGKCRAVWDACDEFHATTKRVPMPKDMKALAETKGWNANNAVIEMYQWRKFNGMISRK